MLAMAMFVLWSRLLLLLVVTKLGGHVFLPRHKFDDSTQFMI